MFEQACVQGGQEGPSHRPVYKQAARRLILSTELPAGSSPQRVQPQRLQTRLY